MKKRILSVLGKVMMVTLLLTGGSISSYGFPVQILNH